MDQRRQVIRRIVADLVASESNLAGMLERAQGVSRRYPDEVAALQSLGPMVQAHRDQLVAYLEEFGVAEAAEEAAPSHVSLQEAAALSELLRDLSSAFHRCALGYAMLFEVALRLYEPRLREIAPEHLKAYADAALSVARLVPGVVARELEQEGLHCACICPMCSIGACGCIAYGTETLNAAWREAATPAIPERPGFVLQPPRPGTQMARAGAEGGDLLLAVDDRQVHVFSDVQTAIRKHALGDEVRLLIRRSSQSPRVLDVRHVSDYPEPP